MIERLLNGLLWLSDLFTKSRDPLLQEFRQRQRLVILSALFSVGSLLAAIIVSPSAYRPDETYQLVVTPVLSMFSTFLAGAGALALAIFMWASYRLWRFMEGYGK